MELHDAGRARDHGWASLGLVARRFGLSAIPAYLLAGLLLGPNEPTQLALISPSEVTEFVAQLGLVFLLFFLGLGSASSASRDRGGTSGWAARSTWSRTPSGSSSA